ncbi:amidohydrolase [Dehalococcoidia bacterium]|nr:amidohydrolase [Dehalococcoidia bacterium]
MDSDGHVMEPDSIWPQYLDSRFHSGAPRRVYDEEGRRILMLEGRLLPQARPTTPDVSSPGGNIDPMLTGRAGGFDPYARIPDQDLEGIDIAVLYPTNALRLPAVQNPELAVALSQGYNNWLSDFCRDHKDRLVGIAAIPIQDMASAIAEAQRAIETLGFRGIFLRPNPYGGRNWDHPFYEPLWSAIEELGVPVAFHEGTQMILPSAGADRFKNHWLRHMISHPHEQQIACLSFIGGGILERHRRLKVAFLESGCGWIGHWLERMDEHVDVFENLAPSLELKPSEYFQRQGFISGDPGEKAMAAMVDLVGDDVIMWASDYPHPDQPFPGASKLLLERKDLSEKAKSKILGPNAARLYGLKL